MQWSSKIWIGLIVVLLFSMCRPFGESIHISVVDDKATPVAGADIHYSWTTGESWTDGPSNGIHHNEIVIANAHGMAVTHIRENHYLAINVTAPGHYASSVNIVDSQLFEHGSSSSALVIPLKRIIAPQKLVAKHAWVILPNSFCKVGYDFVAGDLVAPFGRGVIADATISWTKPAPGSGISSENLLGSDIFGDDCGVLCKPVNTGNGTTTSELLSDYSAPKHGYFSSFKEAQEKEHEQKVPDFITASSTTSDFDTETNFAMAN
ncbi:MAG: hypothetical protein QM796_05670 [Chthoniobacteraceae bacterium]